MQCGGPPVKGADGLDVYKGYCANPTGFKGESDIAQAPFSELVCTRCPPKNDKMFAGDEARQETQRKFPGIAVCM